MDPVWDLGIARLEQGEHAWIPRRLATDDEVARLAAAHAELNAWVTESPFSRLNVAYSGFFEAMRATAHHASINGRMDGRELKSALDNWLTNFRAFDDKTSHLLSSTYGKESNEFKAWKSSLSVEFDSNFAYRFICKLRNYAQHVNESIQHAGFNSSLGADGATEIALMIEFDPDALLDRYADWGPVRADLLARRGSRIDVPSAVISAMSSCNRAMIGLMGRESPRLDAACRVIEAADSEVAEPDAISTYMKFEVLPDGKITGRLLGVRPEVAIAVRELLVRAAVEGESAHGGAPEPRS